MVCPSLSDEELVFLPFPIHVFTIVCHLRKVKFCQSGFCISEVENLPQITHTASIHWFSYPGHGLGFSTLSSSLRASVGGHPGGSFLGSVLKGATPWEWKPQWAPKRMSIWFDSTPLPSHQCLPLPACISPEFSHPLERLHWDILYRSVLPFLTGELPLTCIECCLYKPG